MEQWLLPWLDEAPWQVTILEINHDDRPFPSNDISDTVIQQILDHPNLKRFYAVNALWTNHTKLHPLPLGLKWFQSHRHPFSESKHDRVQQLSHWVGTRADDVKQKLIIATSQSIIRMGIAKAFVCSISGGSGHDGGKEVNASSIIQKARELIDWVDEFQFEKVFVKGQGMDIGNSKEAGSGKRVTQRHHKPLTFT
ncbi:hypothetical protein IV203_011409 [Nitzschia inconspicua]|uniref:Uncharacterized protein n=1 Tax=Nitzschia inconspicua TaxID=303405 RepID=A0A9K3KSA0_9STRA|nr:hypothetical protein IV203_011409 [Nitzschia inconspicua]